MTANKLKKKKLGLVLEGGGVKGAYQAGALKAVHELGVTFDGVAGTSIGAINGALLLQGGFELLSATWDEVTTCTVFDIDDEMIAKFKKKDFDLDMLFYAGKKLTSLREVIKSSYEISSDFLKEKVDESIIRNSTMDYGFVTYDMSNMKALEAMKQDIPEGMLIDYVIASATFPIFPPKIIEGKKYIDGGVYDNMPINLLARNGYDRIFVIRTNTASKTPKRRLERNDLELFTVAPEKDLGRAMSFTEEKIDNLRELGYNDCKKALENGLSDFLAGLELSKPEKKTTEVAADSVPETEEELNAKTTDEIIAELKIFEKIKSVFKK